MGKNLYLVDVSDIFYFFLVGEGEEGSLTGQEGGGEPVFLLKIPQGGGGFQEGEGQGGCVQRMGEFRGGGLNIFFRGRTSTKLRKTEKGG